VILALTHKPVALTGNEIHFIRTYFEMTLQNFGKQFGVTHAAVLTWERTRNRPAKINPTTELYVRLLILEKLDKFLERPFASSTLLELPRLKNLLLSPLFFWVQI